MYVICARAKNPICGMSSFFHPITSPRKEKKSAAASAHCLLDKAQSVSQSKGNIIRAGKGIGTKSNTARMRKTRI